MAWSCLPVMYVEASYGSAADDISQCLSVQKAATNKFVHRNGSDFYETQVPLSLPPLPGLSYGELFAVCPCGFSSSFGSSLFIINC